MRSPLFALGALFAATLGGCASAPASAPAPLGIRVAVATPRDAVPIRARDALPGEPGAVDLEAARSTAMAALRNDLAAALRERGLEVVELEAESAAAAPIEPVVLADRGRAAGASFTIDTEVVAYGDIRRSWLWILGAQALAAGVGHYAAVQAATGDDKLALTVGVGEFLLETGTWVGGALVGGRILDPVLVRIRAVDTASGAVVRHMTREGARPFRNWFVRGRDLPPRDVRLRAVAERIFEKLAPKLARKLGESRHPGDASAGSDVGSVSAKGAGRLSGLPRHRGARSGSSLQNSGSGGGP